MGSFAADLGFHLDRHGVGGKLGNLGVRIIDVEVAGIQIHAKIRCVHRGTILRICPTLAVMPPWFSRHSVTPFLAA